MKLVHSDILKLTAPIFAEQVFTMSIGVLNTILAAHIDDEAVSAIGMVNSLSVILIACFSALAVGGTVVVAHYTGRNSRKDANEAAKQALFSGLAISLGVTLLLWIFRYPVVYFLFGSAEPEVINDSIVYLQISLLTYPLIAITSIASGVLRGAGDTRTPMQLNIMMNVVNLVMSYILIYGLSIQNAHLHIAIPGMKVEGAALGMAAARLAGALGIMLTLVRGSKIIKIDSLTSFRFNREMQKTIFNVGIPSSIESLMFNGGKLITQIFIVDMGTAAITANTIAGSVASMINIPGVALSIAAPTLVGQCMGRGDSEEAKKSLKYVTFLSSALMLAICAVIFPLSGFISAVYTQSGDVIRLSSFIIRLTSVFTPLFWSVAFVMPAGLNGAGDTKYTMATSVTGMWAFRIVLGYVFGILMKMGVAGVWLGMFIDWVVRGTMYCFRLKGGRWKKHVIIKPMDEADEFMA